MIRNYYTDSYKGGRAVVPSDTLLIAGNARAALSTTSNTNLALANSTALTLSAPNPLIQVGMQLSGTSVAGNIPTSGEVGYPVTIQSIDNTFFTSLDNFAVSTANSITLATNGSGYSAVTGAATTSSGVGTGMTITTTVGAGALSTLTANTRGGSSSSKVQLRSFRLGITAGMVVTGFNASGGSGDGVTVLSYSTQLGSTNSNPMTVQLSGPVQYGNNKTITFSGQPDTSTGNTAEAGTATTTINMKPSLIMRVAGTGYVTQTGIPVTTTVAPNTFQAYLGTGMTIDIVADGTGAITSATVNTVPIGENYPPNVTQDRLGPQPTPNQGTSEWCILVPTQAGGSGAQIWLAAPTIELGDVITGLTTGNGATVTNIVYQSNQNANNQGNPFSPTSWQVTANGNVTYTDNDVLTFTPGNGGIATGTIVAEGTGYKTGDIVTVAAPGTGGTFDVSATKSLTLATPNANIVAGAAITGGGLAVGTTISSVINSSVFELSTAQAIAPNSVLNYSGDGLSYTLSSPITFSAATQITYAALNQSSWKEYNLYIGSSPGQVITNNNNASTNTSLVLKSPDPDIKVNMFVGGVGVPANCKITAISTVLGTMTITVDKTLSIAANIALTYSFESSSTIRVGTINDNVLTFTNPLQGTILPVSVVQVYSTGTNHVSSLIALD